MRSYSEWLKEKQQQYRNYPFSDEKLSKQFIEHWEKAPVRRVKVEFSYGETAWGYVGVTTGWTPTFILMRRLGQFGSRETLSDADKIVAWKDKR